MPKQGEDAVKHAPVAASHDIEFAKRLVAAPGNLELVRLERGNNRLPLLSG
jgi:hypothetical protein